MPVRRGESSAMRGLGGARGERSSPSAPRGASAGEPGVFVGDGELPRERETRS